ncbi:MAG: hypothetical protein FWG08_04645 [Propionibacteriaceae bacterium]|nr:hypothetical protein [Propionibacteriaceae bacterium]
MERDYHRNAGGCALEGKVEKGEPVEVDPRRRNQKKMIHVDPEERNAQVSERISVMVSLPEANQIHGSQGIRKYPKDQPCRSELEVKTLAVGQRIEGVDRTSKKNHGVTQDVATGKNHVRWLRRVSTKKNAVEASGVMMAVDANGSQTIL